jgi:hypothetical protein
MQVSTTSSTSTDGIDWLFGELHGMYGNRFLDAYRSGHVANGVDTGIENAKRTWAERIRANGMTRGQLRRGLAACERLRFPPTWGEFLTLCVPEVEPAAAYQEAIAGLEARGKGEMGEWSHPAVYWAAAELRTDLMLQTYGAVRERWQAALKRQMGRGEWEPIPAPRAALPAPGQGQTTREEAARRLQELGAAGILRTASRPGDGRTWADRILARAAAGDPTLPSVSLRYARELARRNQDGTDGDMRGV